MDWFEPVSRSFFLLAQSLSMVLQLCFLPPVDLFVRTMSVAIALAPRQSTDPSRIFPLLVSSRQMDARDVSYEEDLLRNPYSLKHWLYFLEYKVGAPTATRFLLFERGTKQVEENRSFFLEILRWFYLFPDAWIESRLHVCALLQIAACPLSLSLPFHFACISQPWPSFLVRTSCG